MKSGYFKDSLRIFKVKSWTFLLIERGEMIGMKSETGLLFRKFITSKISFSKKNRNPHTVSMMKYSTNETDSSTVYDGAEDKRKKRTRDMTNILRQFEGQKLVDHVDDVPRRIIRTTKSKPRELYLFNESTANYFTDSIKEDLLADPQKIIEVNPGIGVLTEKLLNAGIPYLNVVESNTKFVQALDRLQKKYPNSIKIQEANLLCLWKLAFMDKYDDGNRVQELFSNYPRIAWGDEPGLKIIGTVVDFEFINHVLLDIVKQSGIASYGRPFLYLCMPPSAWLTNDGILTSFARHFQRLTCDKTAGLGQYRNLSVLFQVLCDYKLLGKVSRRSFLPWLPHYDEKKINCSKRYKMDKDELCMVKIEGKKNLFTEIVSEKQIKLLWYFINQHMVARTRRVIPQMEIWQPGCGPKLITQDYNIFTQFGDLSPPEFVKLFNEFSTWEGFHNMFVPSFENSPQKVEQLLF